MKKILFAFAIMTLFSAGAKAAELTYDKAYSTATSRGVICTTGTVVNIAQTLAGFNISGQRISNDDASNDIFFGYGIGITTHTATVAARTARGVRLTPRANAPIQLGYNNDTKSAGAIYCKAADAAGVGGVVVVVETFGFN